MDQEQELVDLLQEVIDLMADLKVIPWRMMFFRASLTLDLKKLANQIKSQDMTIEMTIEEELGSKQMLKEKVDHRTEVKATDHQEFLTNLHQTSILEIPMLDPNTLVDKVLTIIQETSSDKGRTTDNKDIHREKDPDQEVIKTQIIIERIT